MIKQFFVKWYLFDVISIIIILLSSYLLISVYSHANYIDVGYQDWLMQAFRVKSLSLYGYNSWTHVWSNGMSFWSTYQFIPHYITLFMSKLIGVSINRTMILLTIALFILQRVFLYCCLRQLKFTPLVSFICVLLSFDIAQYWEGVGDYSLLFAFTFFPLMLFLWIKYHENKISYMFIYIIGLCFYIHILLGFVMSVLWVFSLIFSNKKIFTKKTALECIILLATSSLFWYPLLIKNSFVYIDDRTSIRSFLDFVLSQYGYYGLSQIIIACLFACLMYIFLPADKTYHWSKTLLIFSLSYFMINIIGVSVELPKIIDQTQFTRGAAMLGIAIIFTFAPLLSKLLSMKYELIRGMIILLCFLAIIDSISIISDHSYTPKKTLEDPVSTFASAHTQIHLNDGRIWTPTLSLSNYMNPLTYRYDYDDMTQQEKNQIAVRLNDLVQNPPITDAISQATIDRLNDYFILSGTKYLFLNKSSPYAQALTDNGIQPYILLGNVTLPQSFYEVVQTPFAPKDAVLISKKYINEMKHFPYSLELNNVNDLTNLDNYVHHFAALINNNDNTPLSISYPTQESIAVNIPANIASNTIYINESYDSQWYGQLNGNPVHIQSTGPNFILVTLPNVEAGTLLLRHTFPLTFYISEYIILLLPLLFFMNFISKKYLMYQQKKM